MGRVIFYPSILFEAVNVQQVLRSPDISGFGEIGEMTKFTEMTLSRTIMVPGSVENDHFGDVSLQGPVFHLHDCWRNCIWYC